jgi:hypothetical protein
MSTFKWVVEEASEESVPVQPGGEVKIADLSVAKVETWHVESPNPTQVIVPQAGGTVAPIKPSAEAAEKMSAGEASILRSLTADTKLFRIVALVVLGFISLAFAAIVIKDIVHDKIDLQTYLMIILSFIGGRGSKSFTNNKHTNQGGGSG